MRLTIAAAARTLLILLAAFGLPAQSTAQSGSVTDILRGQVSDERGQPVQGARVEARDLDSGLRRATPTEASGRYTLVFPDGSGRYEVTVAMVGTAGARVLVEREADEDVLVANVRLRTQAVALEPLQATAGRRAAPPAHPDAGSV